MTNTIRFELGGFLIIGLILVFFLHWIFLLIYGLTASLWLIGRIQYELKRGQR